MRRVRRPFLTLPLLVALDGNVHRRERNREHAKRSRVRKKFLLESLQKSVTALKEENDKLRDAIRSNLGADVAKELLEQTDTTGVIASSPGEATKVNRWFAAEAQRSSVAARINTVA